MRYTKKLMLILLALLLVCVAACKNSDDDDDSSSKSSETKTSTANTAVSAVATFFGVGDASALFADDEDVTAATVQMTVTFYSDKTYDVGGNFTYRTEGELLALDATYQRGTYEGDATKNGAIALKATQELNFKTKQLEEINPTAEDFVIESDAVTLKEDDFSITLKRFDGGEAPVADGVTAAATFFGVGDVTTFAADGNSDITAATAQMTVTFYSDKSYTIALNFTIIAEKDNEKLTYAERYTQEKGTYTGDATKNGTLELTTTHEYNNNSEKLEAVNPSKRDFVVANGEVTYTEDDFSMTLTRQ